MDRKKLYILDTNVLIHDPKALVRFSEANVAIPLTVLEELDKFKTDNSQRGFSAREAIRTLDKLRSQGSLKDGVHLEHGGTVRILTFDQAKPCTEFSDMKKADNQILNAAICAQRDGASVEFITKDLNMRVKADAIGLPTVDYLKDIIQQDEFYKGWITLPVPSVQLKQPIPQDLLRLVEDQQLLLNEYVIVTAQHNEHHYRVFRYTGGKNFVPVVAPKLRWNFEPRNVQQLIALDLLLNDEIPVVSLFGGAGTGKTLLALVAALYKVLVEEKYLSLLVTRPIIPLGPDVGYLPGELQEKLFHWMQPVYDNMDLIVHMTRSQQQDQQERDQNGNGNGSKDVHHGKERLKDHDERRDHKRYDGNGHNGKNGHKHHERHKGNRQQMQLENLISQGKVSLEAITYMRGRSIPYRYIFIDEVQNLTPHEVKTIVSRVGNDSKIVLAGDPYQIDSPYLDFASNGLMVLTDRFKGQSLFGTVYLERSERSAISTLASDLL